MSIWLITRPEPDASALAGALAALGHRGLVAPVMAIETATGVQLDLDDVQALAFTSANGVRAYVANGGSRDVPVFAVGGVTAKAAAEMGFAEVSAAQGTVRSLADRIAGDLDPTGGAVLHVRGSDVAGDLQADLEARGIRVRRAVLYSAVPVVGLPASVCAAIHERACAGVLFFSPRTADLFVRLATRAGVMGALGDLDAVCLSPAVAARLEPSVWRTILTAKRPTANDLLDLLPDSAAVADPADQHRQRS